MSSDQYRKSHCGDKTILRPSYLHNGISYTGKTALYWIRPQVSSMAPNNLINGIYRHRKKAHCQISPTSSLWQALLGIFIESLTILWDPGSRLIIKTIFLGMGISIIKIRWSWDHIIFIMGIPLACRVERRHLYIKQSDTKPNLVAKIWLPNLVSFFLIYVMLSQICSMWL